MPTDLGQPFATWSLAKLADYRVRAVDHALRRHAADRGRHVSITAAYALFLPIGLDSGYAAAMLPTFILAGLGFALAFGPLNVAATNGVAPEEQGLAGGLLNTSFQFGGAVVLAIVTAVINADVGAGGSPRAILDGYHAALYVSVGAALLGLTAMLQRTARRAVEPEPALEEIVEDAAHRSAALRTIMREAARLC